ncbi:O-antigen/teichoic acid export membrane protein [Inhella inkyongensis]|uniref:O-antigen/teichoic acid export membrane protein n=1 Tax=Inhella inkyongensis TaxID=392593 RepID=A0A840S7F8_9BURK|nr:oligosaccharide flippase family protein [Inhella inkyongensis]MBB5204501.1 O-antigen/teichoic acid export membrane protein [Inhella inkyongensis]
MAGRLLPAVLTLLAGGAAAQALPLLLGPWLTRLYTPADFGAFHLFAAVAANLGVVACARYEFALPLAQDEAEAHGLRALALRVLVAVTVLSVVGGAAAAGVLGPHWLLLGPSVGLLGLVSLAGFWATRALRFRAVALARFLSQGSAPIWQLLLHGVGVLGLVLGPLLASVAALLTLRLPLRAPVQDRPVQDWRLLARAHRDFPLLNTPHAFMGALQDTLSLALIAQTQGLMAAGFWGLALRYLKAPAGLMGSAVSQALYPLLARSDRQTGRETLLRTMALLFACSLPLAALLMAFGADAFAWAFGERWRPAGELGAALAPYLALHFVASPLSVAPLAWGCQAWALRLSLVGQGLHLLAIGLGLQWGGLTQAAWLLSLFMAAYFGYFFWRLPGLARDGTAKESV